MKKAFTLIETLIVLGIASLVSAGTYLTYQYIKEVRISNEEVRRMYVARNNIQTLYASAPNYDGVNQTWREYLNNNFFDSSVGVDSNNRFKNSFDYGYYINSGYGGSYLPGVSPTKSFYIRNQVPIKYCERIVQGLLNFNYVSVGLRNTNEDNVVKHWDGTVDSSKIIKGCHSGGDSEFVYIWAYSQ